MPVEPWAATPGAERVALVPERGPAGGEADGAAVDAAGGPGHDQAASGDGWVAAVEVLPHVPGDRDLGAHAIALALERA